MAFLKVSELAPNMVTASNVKTDSGLILVRRNTSLTERIIEKLNYLVLDKKLEILDETIIKQPETETILTKALPSGQKSDKGYIINEKIENTEFAYAGTLIVNSDVENCKIRTTGSILVLGNVTNTNFLSISGGIRIEGNVYADKAGYQIVCEKNLILKSAENYSLVTNSNLEVSKELKNCSVRVNYVFNGGKATVSKCNVEVGDKSVFFIFGDEKKGNCEIKISYRTMKKLFQRILLIDTEMRDIQKEISDLRKNLDIIRLLGDKISALPPNKQMMLKEKNQFLIKHAQALKKLQDERTQIIDSLKGMRDSEDVSVRITGFVFPCAIIKLDKVAFEVREVLSNVGFYKKGIVRIRNFDSKQI